MFFFGRGPELTSYDKCYSWTLLNACDRYKNAPDGCDHKDVKQSVKT